MIPCWLHDLSIVYLLAGILSSLIIALDLVRRPQHMWIMNVVWPVTALFGTVGVIWQYFRFGQLSSKDRVEAALQRGEKMPSMILTPFPIIVANGALHCGSGCAIGDIIAEWLAFTIPAIAVAFGWHTIFSEKMFAVWVLDFILAYIFGIVFQYFTIAPMRDLSLGKGIIQAIKADTLSLSAWQIGMYGFMAFAYFSIFDTLIGKQLEVNSVEFWFMMQIAMLCGFATAYPVNWWLIKTGIKEKM